MDTPDLEAAALADAIHRLVAMTNREAATAILADLPEALTAETFSAARTVAKRLAVAIPRTERAQFLDASPTWLAEDAPPVLKALAARTSQVLAAILTEEAAERGNGLSDEEELETIVAGALGLATLVERVDPALAGFARATLAEADASDNRQGAALSALDVLACRYVEIVPRETAEELREYSVKLSFSTGFAVTAVEGRVDYVTVAEAMKAHYIGQALAHSLKEATR